MTMIHKSNVRFLGGAMPRADLIGLMAYPAALDGSDREFTRFYMVSNQQWVQQEFDSDINSACYLPEGDERGWWLLGKRGDVHSLTAKGRQSEQIPQAGTGSQKQGYLKKIDVIADMFLACGYRRQVYRRQNGQWLSIADDIAASRSDVGFCFNDIAGRSNNDIYAVGNRGEIFHYNGRHWFACDSGTNVHLECIACLGNRVVVAGRDGVILLGDHNGFTSIGPATADLNFWDITVFDGRVFVTASTGVFELNPATDFSFDPAPFPKHIGYKLTVGPEHLLSIGTHQVFSYNGQTVEELICPDNI